MPQSSEQYLELGLAASTQLGPKHWRCPVLSRRSPFSLYLVLSLCFCFCLCRRDSFWFKRSRRPVFTTYFHYLPCLHPNNKNNNNNNHHFSFLLGNSYFLVKLLFSSLDMLHLHSFLAHDWTEKRLIIVITSPCLGERRTNENLYIQLSIKCFICWLAASKMKKKSRL